MSLVEIRDLKRIYHINKMVEVEALKGIDLCIEEGDFVAITGTSGSGKSTLLHILGGIDKNYEGTYLFEGGEVRSLTKRRQAQFRNKKIGIVLQNFGLLPELSVYDNIALPVYLGKKRMKKEKLHETVWNLLQQVSLENKMQVKAKMLSGGQKQRVAIARALINEPKLILADEPTGALDKGTTQEIMSVFQTLHEQGHTIVIVTHDPEIADSCDRRIQLEDGRIQNN